MNELCMNRCLALLFLIIISVGAIGTLCWKVNKLQEQVIALEAKHD